VRFRLRAIAVSARRRTPPDRELAGKIAKPPSLCPPSIGTTEDTTMPRTPPPTVTRWVLVVAALAPVGAVVAADPDGIRWRTDYNAARVEAKEKGLPILLDLGTEHCTYCRKMDATTFQDPGIVAMLTTQFIPLKIDGNRDAELVKALGVQMYPTVVLAGPDGKIHNTLQGYQTVDQLRESMKLSVTTATAALVVKAATTGNAIVGDKTNLVRAREVLSLAKDEYRGERYANCLDHCEYLAAVYSELPEGREAATLIARIKTDPDRLAVATAQVNEKAANLQLVLGDAYLKRGNPKDALTCFEHAMRLAPGGKSAEYAQAQLTLIKRK
jgi:thioredoxin-like negative regulator of GroEL